MAELDIGQTTTTNFTGSETKFTVGAEVPDSHRVEDGDTFWDYSNASTDLGYYMNIAEAHSSINALATYVTGQGFETDNKTVKLLENISGSGEDGFLDVLWNQVVMTEALGDAMAEIVRNDKAHLINLKPLWIGDMRSVWNKQGMIKHYVHIPSNKIFQPHQIFHTMRNRIANQVHGTSIFTALKKIIDLKAEALDDEGLIRHREMLGVLEVDTEDTTKITAAINAVQTAYKKKEVLVTMKGVSELKDNPMTTKDRLSWMTYLDNLFYQSSGVPKAIVTSEGLTEAGGKVGFLTFQPFYTRKQVQLESDLWNQIAIKIKFNKPPQLGGMMREDEQKNTGQTSIQPNDTQVQVGRE